MARYRKTKKTYTLTRTNILACLIIIAGIFFWVQGLICSYNLEFVKNSYKTSSIKTGNYIEYDISREQLIGDYYNDVNGTRIFKPYSVTDAVLGSTMYIGATNDDLDCYIPIKVPRSYRDDFNQMVSGSIDTYHLFGKITWYTGFSEKFADVLTYDSMAEYLGIDVEELGNMFSDNHKLKLVDPKAEGRITFKGLSLILIGSLILRSSDRIVKKENNDYAYVRKTMAKIEKRKKKD